MNLPQGFKASGVVAGLKSSGALDLALIANVGPTATCAGVFTSNKMKAAPVLWSQQIVSGGAIRAVVLNSGGANACTGPQGFADTHRTAEYLAQELNFSSSEIAVCSTGLIGEYLPMEKLLKGISDGVSKLSEVGLVDSATAIMTTDTHPKIATVNRHGVTVTGIAKGAGMLAPSLATMLSVIMTDAVLPSEDIQGIFTSVVDRSYNRIDSDGCTSTNDTVLLLGSGSSGVELTIEQIEELLLEVSTSLSLQLIEDAEGHTKIVSIKVVGAMSESDAVNVGRACARNNLLKCALFGGDPNWGRILAAVGTADADFDAYRIDVWLNGVMVARASAPGEDRTLVDLSKKEISIVIDLKMGSESATIYTNDLSHDYVHENSAYAT
jgi:glutamate N-acetyltransferase/amino-acid N-acetyltransferase